MVVLVADAGNVDANLTTAPGSGSQIVTYTVPTNVAIKVQSVVATITNGAAAAITPELTIVDSSGVVIARKRQVRTMPAGDNGTATWALRLDDDAAGDTTVGGFPALVASLTGLRAYWRLGEAASPFRDTSGYSPGAPADLVLIVNGTASTLNTTGALSAADDDGALTQNYAGTTASLNADADFIRDESTDTRFAPANLSVGGWVKPQASGNSWQGGIVSVRNYGGGFDEGWALYLNWPAQTLGFWQGGAGFSSAMVTGSALTANAWHFVVATYDGTTMRLYIDGTLDTSAASGIGVIGMNQITVGNMSQPTYRGRFYGSLDEMFVTATVLDAAQIAALRAAR